MTAPSDQGQADSPPDPPPGNGAPGTGRTSGSSGGDDVSLLDILLILARHKTLIVRTVLVLMLLDVTYALLAPEKFTSEAHVVREVWTVERSAYLGRSLWGRFRG